MFVKVLSTQKTKYFLIYGNMISLFDLRARLFAWLYLLSSGEVSYKLKGSAHPKAFVQYRLHLLRDPPLAVCHEYVTEKR